MNKTLSKAYTSLLLACAITFSVPAAHAETLSETLNGMLNNHQRIKASASDAAASKERIRETQGQAFPQFEVLANYGRESQTSQTSNVNTNLTFTEVDLTVTQLLTDFGATRAAVDVAELTHEQSVAVLDTVSQSLLLEGVSAYINLSRADNMQMFALKSVDNIKRQTEMENAILKHGKGYSTDVLQAKTQLAGAHSRAVQAQGAYLLAESRFQSVFNRVPSEDDVKNAPTLAIAGRLPASMEAAEVMAIENNHELKALRVAVAAADKQHTFVRRDLLYPTIQAIGEAKFKDNVAGVKDFEKENLIKVELYYPINLGVTVSNSMKAAKQAKYAAESRVMDTENLIKEQVRNAWYSLQTAKANAETLSNQVALAKHFLSLARKERKNGKRSLLDVLAGETMLINAQSDASSAQADIAVAAYTLLHVTGQLNTAMFN